MKRKADLFQLIKAMSKSEKRYFTLDAQKSGRKDARYLELFQVINEQETYDEAPLKEKFDKTLPTDKTYLYEAILRSMRDYRSANSYAARIKEMIMDAKYLYERGLYDQSEERLNAAKELADQFGDQLSMIELNKEHRGLLKYTKRKGYESELKNLIAEKDNNVTYLLEELYYLDVLDKLLIELRKNPQQLEHEKREQLKNQFPEIFSNNVKEPSSMQGRLRFYQCMALTYQFLGNTEQMYYYYAKIVECWDSNPKYKEEEFFRYILDVSNLLHYTFSDASKAHNLPQLLTKLETERPANFHDQKVLFQRITSYRLIHAINKGEFQDVHLIINRIDRGLKKYNLAYSSEIVIIFNVAVLLFMSSEFNTCIEWSERIISKTNIDVRQDIQEAIRIVQLVATVEIEDIEKVELRLRNTSRYLNKIKSEHIKINNNIIKNIKELYFATPSEAKKVIKKFRDYLVGIKQSDVKIPLGVDELLLYWLDSRINQQPISAIIRAKTLKTSP